MQDIRGIILDVDGVIVGKKIGVNTPDPHEAVIEKLKELRQKGLTISLCTAKPYFAIKNIVELAQLNNLHITDGGGAIINPIDHVVVQKHAINKESANDLIHDCLTNEIYIEIHTPDDYFIQKNQISDFTEKHAFVLQQEPVLVDDLVSASELHEITKIMVVAKDLSHKEKIKPFLATYQDKLTLSWGVHPPILPLQFGIITAPGISKREGAIELSRASSIPLENMLGVGDSESDWQFISLCQYGAAMGNASQELKDLVLSKGLDHSFIGPSVDENGILNVLNHFLEK